LGLDLQNIERSLRERKNGVSFCPDFEEKGFKSRVAGWIKDWNAVDHFDRKLLKFLGRGSEFTSYAAMKALENSQLPEKDVHSERCGVIVGCGEGSSEDMMKGAYIMKERNNPRKIGIRVPKIMSSSRSANISLLIKNKGMSLGISDACATGLVNIGYAYQVIKWGVQDVVFAGGGDSCDWYGTCFFDAMGVLATGYNETPEKASRPFDKDRTGFVMGEGGGILVLEELEHAISRVAPIYGEIIGYATNCDGGISMVAPSKEGQVRCINEAINNSACKPGEIDYINTHGTSTKAGDPSEIAAIKEVFKDHSPMLTSIKSQIGHTIGAAGALELIASMIMLKSSFIAPSLNLYNQDEACSYPNIITTTKEVEFDTFLTNNFAFGGSNSSMIVRKYHS